MAMEYRCEMKWNESGIWLVKWNKSGVRWSEIVKWNEFFNFSQMVHQTSLKFSEVVTINIMHLPTKNLSHWLNRSSEKWEMAVGESGQFLEEYTLKFSKFFCVYLPYLNAFAIKISGPMDEWFESYDQINFCPISPFLLHNVATKQICHKLILRPNWVIQKGNCVFLPFLLPHAFRISFWWRKGAAMKKYQNLS